MSLVKSNSTTEPLLKKVHVFNPYMRISFFYLRRMESKKQFNSARIVQIVHSAKGPFQLTEKTFKNNDLPGKGIVSVSPRRCTGARQTFRWRGTAALRCSVLRASPRLSLVEPLIGYEPIHAFQVCF